MVKFEYVSSVGEIGKSVVATVSRRWEAPYGKGSVIVSIQRFPTKDEAQSWVTYEMDMLRIQHNLRNRRNENA